MKASLIAFTGILATNFFWATNAMLAIDATRTIAPLHLNFWRWVFALGLLLPFGYKAMIRGKYIRNNFLYLGLLGFLGISLYNLVLYSAAQSTSTTNITLISSLAPVSILLVSWLLVGKSPSVRQLAGMLIGLVGALIIITRADFQLLFGLNFNLGDSFMLVAVVVWGLYSVLLVRLRGSIRQIELLTLLIAFGVLWLVVLELTIYGSLPFKLLLHTNNLLLFAYLGIFPSLLAYLLWNNGIEHLGPVTTGLSIYSQPVFGALLSWMFFNQLLNNYHMIAAACIVIALVLCLIKNRSHK